MSKVKILGSVLCILVMFFVIGHLLSNYAAIVPIIAFFALVGSFFIMVVISSYKGFRRIKIGTKRKKEWMKK